PERRQGLVVGPAGEVGGVDQAERERRQLPAALPPLRGGLHDGRGVPFAEHGQVALAHQPLVEQVELGALSRTVDPLDDEQLSGEVAVLTHRSTLLPRTPPCVRRPASSWPTTIRGARGRRPAPPARWSDRETGPECRPVRPEVFGAPPRRPRPGWPHTAGPRRCRSLRATGRSRGSACPPRRRSGSSPRAGRAFDGRSPP